MNLTGVNDIATALSRVNQGLPKLFAGQSGDVLMVAVTFEASRVMSVLDKDTQFLY